MGRHILHRILLPAIAIFLPSIAEAQDSHATGLLLMDGEEYQSLPYATRPVMGQLPVSIDLSSSFPEPGDQGLQGSCVGWALSYLKAFQEISERGWSSSAPGSRFSPSYIYNQAKESKNCNSGAQIYKGLNVLRVSGAAQLKDFSYDPVDCSRLPSPEVRGIAAEFSIAAWNKVNTKDPLAVKTHLAASFPVVIAMIIDDEFHNLRGDEIYLGNSGINQSGHALVVVGYDDARNAFKVINSWGTKWGDGGFGWIHYAAFEKKVVEAYVAQDVIVRSPEIEPAPIEEVVVPPTPETEPDADSLPQPEPRPRRFPYSGWDATALADFSSSCLADRVNNGVLVSKRLSCEYGGCNFRLENSFPNGELAFFEIDFVIREISEIWAMRPSYTSVVFRCEDGACISYNSQKQNWTSPQKEYRRNIELDMLSRRCADMLVRVFD